MVLFAPKMIEKFRAQGAEEGLRQGVEIGVEIGVKQEREKWQAWQQRVDAWYQRLQDAQANGQPFNEPPPAPDGNHESP
jgi:flagellar biosynthesis/type III secretory pathway protein FliH